jgi:hypothetical protein
LRTASIRPNCNQQHSNPSVGGYSLLVKVISYYIHPSSSICILSGWNSPFSAKKSICNAFILTKINNNNMYGSTYIHTYNLTFDYIFKLTSIN